VLVSSDTVDDAGVYRLTDDLALVFTIDFFTPIVDDARDFGRIAAANAVSDVYAMGGTPFLAVNVACFPDEELAPSILADILLGGQEKMEEAGAVIVGGHTVSDRELKYGLAVVGRVHPDRIVTNAGAEPGDALVLTKPIGTGVLTTALKNDRLSDESLERVTRVMSTLNRAAAEAMIEAGARAATDVTGFGLIGHAAGLADASGVTIEIDVDGVPLLEGALETVSAGMRPGGLFANQQFYGRFVRSATRADDETIELLYDPQTSGGLLIALPAARVAAFERAFADAGGAESWRVGRIVERTAESVALA
jgi:selenide,water dikinase